MTADLIVTPDKGNIISMVNGLIVNQGSHIEFVIDTILTIINNSNKKLK